MTYTESQEKLSDNDFVDVTKDLQQFPPVSPDAQEPPKESTKSKWQNFRAKAWTYLKGVKAEPIMALYGLGFYMPQFFIQNMVIEKLCMVDHPAEVCLNKTNSTVEEETQHLAAQYLMIHYLVRQLPAVILSLFMGSWSDIYGRKYVIHASLIGNILSFVLYLLNYYYKEWPAEYIIFAGIPSGLTGDYAAFMLGLFGFIKDVHTIQELSLKISTTDGIEMLSSQVGPLIGGQLFSRFSYPAIFGFGIACHFLAMVVTQLFVTDSTFQVTKWSTMCRNFFRLSGFLDCLKCVVKKREDNKRAYIFAVLVTAMVIFFGYFGHAEIIFLYTRLKLAWDVLMVTNYNMAFGGCATIALVLVMPLILHFFKLTDITLGLLGHLGFMAFYLGTAFANDTVSMFAVCIFQCVATMSFVTLRSCISKCVSSSEVGKIMAMYAVLQALCRNLGQIISTQIYVATLKTFVGAFFVVAGALFIINISLYSWVFMDMKKRNFILNDQDTEGKTEAAQRVDIVLSQDPKNAQYLL